MGEELRESLLPIVAAAGASLWSLHTKLQNVSVTNKILTLLSLL